MINPESNRHLYISMTASHLLEKQLILRIKKSQFLEAIHALTSFTKLSKS